MNPIPRSGLLLLAGVALLISEDASAFTRAAVGALCMLGRANHAPDKNSDEKFTPSI